MRNQPFPEGRRVFSSWPKGSKSPGSAAITKCILPTANIILGEHLPPADPLMRMQPSSHRDYRLWSPEGVTHQYCVGAWLLGIKSECMAAVLNQQMWANLWGSNRTLTQWRGFSFLFLSISMSFLYSSVFMLKYFIFSSCFAFFRLELLTH